MRYLLQNAQLLSSGGVFRAADVLLSGGRIVSIGDRISCPADAVSIDLHKAVLFPGFVDVHVHLREPGFSYKETIRTGTLAAAHGGFAHVAAMPNLDPVPDCAAALAVQRAIIEKDALVHVHPYGAVSVGEKGERLADLDGLAPGVIAFSDDGRGVQSESLMREAMMQCRRLGKILAAHCEDNSLLHGGYIHDGAYARAHGHRGICSESEWGPIARDLRLAEETGCAYHVCHVSTKESVALIRAAKRRGVDVTCETAPHYLTFTDRDARRCGAVMKTYPLIRTAADRQAVWQGLADGTLDWVCSDHAPHTCEEKHRSFWDAPAGISGIEGLSPVLLTAVHRGLLTLPRVAAITSANAARTFGLYPRKGVIRPGADADLAIVDMSAAYTFRQEKMYSKAKWSPYDGMSFQGRVVETILRGRTTMRDGQVLPDCFGQFLPVCTK